MSIPSSTAKQLCTKAELSLFTESQTRNVKNLDAKALKTRIERCRKLRDKYKQLANRQDREARAKQEPRRRQAAQGSTATRKKEQLFAESLVRFQRQLDKAETVDAKPVKTVKKKAVTKKKVATETSPATKVTTKKKVAAKKAVTKKKTAKTKAPPVPPRRRSLSRRMRLCQRQVRGRRPKPRRRNSLLRAWSENRNTAPPRIVAVRLVATRDDAVKCEEIFSSTLN